jgi:hypothetical protein
MGKRVDFTVGTPTLQSLLNAKQEGTKIFNDIA